VFLFNSHRSSASAFVATALGLSWWASAVSADEMGAPPVKSLETIVVTATRIAEPMVDEVMKQQVQTALHDDPYFYDEHVTVTVKNGVVHLTGMVFDPGDMQDVRRIIRKRISGVKRVVNELEICSCDGGGGG
jgi:osmotically-inducible protein OsmY